MKSFSQFFKEDPNKPIKQFGDNVTSSPRVKATSDILKAGGITSSQKKTASNVLGNLNRFFTDKPDSETLKTTPTGDEGEFKGNKKTKSVVTTNIKKSIPRKTKKVSVGALDKRDAAIKKLDKITIEPQKGDAQKTKDLIKKLKNEPNKVKTPPVTTTSKPKVTTGNKINFIQPPETANKTIQKKITSSKIDLKKGQKQLRDLDLDKIKTNKTPRVKRFVTKPKSITDFKGFIKRGAQRTGLTQTKPKIEVGGKLKTLPANKVTKDILKQTPKSLKLSRALGALGRVTGGAYAVKDFMDVARKEKALGRGKTSARIGGLSRALGGYIGGGIGATLGSSVAGLPGGIVGGGAGYHYGSKVGDKLYNIGRQYATGEKKLNVGKTFKNLRNDINANTKKLNLRNLGRLDKDKK